MSQGRKPSMLEVLGLTSRTTKMRQDKIGQDRTGTGQDRTGQKLLSSCDSTDHGNFNTKIMFL